MKKQPFSRNRESPHSGLAQDMALREKPSRKREKNQKRPGQKELTLIYWKGKEYWLGKLAENPEIMSQGRTRKELIVNIRDAYHQVVLDDVPADYRTLDITV